MTDEQFQKIFDQVMMSSDLRKAIGQSDSEIGGALYAKLDYSVIAGIEEFLNELKSEADDSLKQIIKSSLLERDRELWDEASSPEETKRLIGLAFQRIEKSEASGLILHSALHASRKVTSCLNYFADNGGDGDFDEFGELLMAAISEVNKLRVTHDVIPLIRRGLHAENSKQAVDFWQLNKDDAKIGNDESAWQKELSKRIGVLQRALGGRVVLLNETAHVGAEGLDGKGDRVTDFLLQHADTKNIVIVEIKTPNTLLLGDHYRNTYCLSKDLSGSVGQVLLQRHDAMTNFYAKAHKSDREFNVAAPRSVVLAGRLDKEIGTDNRKRSAFEMQRQALESNVRIITFDELYSDFSNFHVLTL